MLSTTTMTSNSACLSKGENETLMTPTNGRVALPIDFSARPCPAAANSRMFGLNPIVEHIA